MSLAAATCSRAAATSIASRTTSISSTTPTGIPLNFQRHRERPVHQPRVPETGAWSVCTDERLVQLQRLQSVFTKSDESSLQGTLTYTVATLKDGDPRPWSGLAEVPFGVNAAFRRRLRAGCHRSADRAVFTGIWDVDTAFS